MIQIQLSFFLVPSCAEEGLISTETRFRVRVRTSVWPGDHVISRTSCRRRLGALWNFYSVRFVSVTRGKRTRFFRRTRRVASQRGVLFFMSYTRSWFFFFTANDTTRQRRTDKEENIIRPPGRGHAYFIVIYFFPRAKIATRRAFFLPSPSAVTVVVETVCCRTRAFFFRAQFSTFIVQG